MSTLTVGRPQTRRAAALRRRLRQRLLRHHLPLALCSGAALAAGAALLTPPSPVVRLTIASAYLALALLAATLLVSPIATLRGRPVTPSSDLRRDLGIWAGALALGHGGLGLWARLGEGAYAISGWLALLLLFGATLTAVAATEIAALLLAISNDAALRWLGLPRWKRLQRLALWLPALASLHGALWLILAGRGALAAAALAALALAPTVARVRLKT